MEKWYNFISKRNLIFLLITFIFSYKNNSLSQTFDIPANFVEGPLIYSYETNLKGISKISPIDDAFVKYSSLELSIVNSKINYPSKWLEDKIYDELGDVAEMERLLRSKDSPLADPIFDQFKHLPIYIDDTIEQLAINPLVFCKKISVLYNKTGKFYELNCTIPFGFFNNYLLMRLQFKRNICKYP